MSANEMAATLSLPTSSTLLHQTNRQENNNNDDAAAAADAKEMHSIWNALGISEKDLHDTPQTVRRVVLVGPVQSGKRELCRGLMAAAEAEYAVHASRGKSAAAAAAAAAAVSSGNVPYSGASHSPALPNTPDANDVEHNRAVVTRHGPDDRPMIDDRIEPYSTDDAEDDDNEVDLLSPFGEAAYRVPDSDGDGQSNRYARDSDDTDRGTDTNHDGDDEKDARSVSYLERTLPTRHRHKRRVRHRHGQRAATSVESDFALTRGIGVSYAHVIQRIPYHAAERRVAGGTALPSAAATWNEAGATSHSPRDDTTPRLAAPALSPSSASIAPTSALAASSWDFAEHRAEWSTHQRTAQGRRIDFFCCDSAGALAMALPSLAALSSAVILVVVDGSRVRRVVSEARLWYAMVRARVAAVCRGYDAMATKHTAHVPPHQPPTHVRPPPPLSATRPARPVVPTTKAANPSALSLTVQRMRRWWWTETTRLHGGVGDENNPLVGRSEPSLLCPVVSLLVVTKMDRLEQLSCRLRDRHGPAMADKASAMWRHDGGTRLDRSHAMPVPDSEEEVEEEEEARDRCWDGTIPHLLQRAVHESNLPLTRWVSCMLRYEAWMHGSGWVSVSHASRRRGGTSDNRSNGRQDHRRPTNPMDTDADDDRVCGRDAGHDDDVPEREDDAHARHGSPLACYAHLWGYLSYLLHRGECAVERDERGGGEHAPARRGAIGITESALLPIGLDQPESIQRCVSRGHSTQAGETITDDHTAAADDDVAGGETAAHVSLTKLHQVASAARHCLVDAETFHLVARDCHDELTRHSDYLTRAWYMQASSSIPPSDAVRVTTPAAVLSRRDGTGVGECARVEGRDAATKEKEKEEKEEEDEEEGVVVADDASDKLIWD